MEEVGCRVVLELPRKHVRDLAELIGQFATSCGIQIPYNVDGESGILPESHQTVYNPQLTEFWDLGGEHEPTLVVPARKIYGFEVENGNGDLTAKRALNALWRHFRATLNENDTVHGPASNKGSLAAHYRNEYPDIGKLLVAGQNGRSIGAITAEGFNTVAEFVAIHHDHITQIGEASVAFFERINTALTQQSGENQ